MASRYDNNLFLTETNQIGAFSMVVAPRADLQVDRRLIQGQLRYQAAAQWYRQEVGLDRFTQRGEVRASLAGLRRFVRHLELDLFGAYTKTGELPDTDLAGDPVSRGGVLFPVTTEITEWRGSITAGYAWSRLFQSRLAYRYVATYLEQSGGGGTIPVSSLATYDSIVHDMRLMFSYRQSPRTTLTLSPGWSVTRVVPSGTDFTSTTETRARARITAGAEYAASSTSSVGGEVGLMVIADDHARLVLTLNLTQDWDRIRFRLRARQSSDVGGGVTDTVSITRSLNADASMPVARHTEARMFLGTIGNMSAPILGAEPTVRVVTFRAGAGIRFELSRWIGMRLDYLSQAQRSAGVDLGGKRHLITVTLFGTAPLWRSGP